MSGWLLKLVVMTIGRSLRRQIDDPTGLLTNIPPHPVIFAFWHNRIFLMPYLFKKHWSRRQRAKVAVLVSASKDGEKLVRVLEKFDLICIRGSSSRRGREALRELNRLLHDGYDAGITPDGPRGPKYQVADGVISLAQLTGAPIVPVSYTLTWKITLKSWDAFMIPLPLGRAVLRLAPPVTIARETSAEEREHKRLELETILKSLSEP